jgi:putative transposase
MCYAKQTKRSRRSSVAANAGYPRYKGRDRYDSFTYPQGGYSLTHDSRLCLSKLGSIKVKLHRPLEGEVKTCTIKREGTYWYVVFVCEVEAELLPVSDESVGIDLGLLHFATLSTGETIENPRYFRKAEKKLEKLQQVLACKKRGSHRRKKAVKKVAKAHRKVRNQRADFLHKESRKLVNAYGTIVFEELQPANMSRRAKPKQDENGTYLPNGASAKSGVNKSIHDAGWGQFVQYCTYKAANAGRTVVQVNPRYTSQVCSGCGTVKKKELSERWHSCECGTELDRDHNAALNILWLGSNQRGATRVEAPVF